MIDKTVSIYDKTVPLNMKHDKIIIKLPKDIKVNEAVIRIKDKPVDTMSEWDNLSKKIEQNYKFAPPLGRKLNYSFVYFFVVTLKM